MRAQRPVRQPHASAVVSPMMRGTRKPKSAARAFACVSAAGPAEPW